jgi:penicillin amidase
MRASPFLAALLMAALATPVLAVAAEVPVVPIYPGSLMDTITSRMGAAPPAKTLASATTRDAQGIWYIEGDTIYDVFEAMGYAVAEDRLFQLELNKRQGRGMLSEILGPDFLSTDVFLRTIAYSEEELTAEFNALSEDGQAAIQGYVDGINRRIDDINANWRLMPYEFWIASFNYVFIEGAGFNVLPTRWTVNDAIAWTAVFFRGFDPEALSTGQLDNAVLAGTLGAVYGQEGLAMFQDLRWLNDPSAQTMVPSPAKAKVVVKDPLTLKDVQSLPDLSDVANEISEAINGYQQQMEEIGIRVKMGSYAWTVSGDKTASGNPIIYSGPQMGFEFPAIITEGSLRGGGLDVSGMHVPGLPGIAVGRTPHHAWSAQVGHAHTTDYFLDPPQVVELNRFETINVAGQAPVTIPVWRTSHGPVINPLPFDPTNPPEFVVSWAYANWGHEADAVDALLEAARAQSVEEFGAGVEKIGVSQHTCYADRDGNIAYWMTGFDPIRAPGVDPRFPQVGDGTQEWTGEFRPRAHVANPEQGYVGGWNNKASIDYINAPQSAYYGPFHRAHVIDEYLAVADDLTFEEIRDLALNIATTDSFGRGGNPWAFASAFFTAAVAGNPTPDREAAIAMLEAWDGHFVAGGPDQWRMGTERADAWVLQDAWIREVIRLTFEDEFAAAGMNWSDEQESILFNVLIRALAGQDAALPTLNNWFADRLGSGKPTDATELILLALDNVIASMGLGPYGAERGEIIFRHDLLAQLVDPLLGITLFGDLHRIPFSSRSTFAHVVEFSPSGPNRIESMIPLGPSGQLWFNGTFVPDFDPANFSMAPNYDPFMPRPFPLFD